MTTQPSGQLLPFTFDNIPVRGMLLRIEDIQKHVPVLAGDKTPKVLKKCLGEILAASAALANDLKHKANITLQVHTEGPVNLMVGQCSADGSLRAYANIDEQQNFNENTKFEDIVNKKSVFAVTVEQQDNKQVYQSLVALNTNSISSSIETYFNDSVQLRTYFKTFTGDIDGKFSCGALFLQILPNSGLSEDDWARLGILLNTIKLEEILPGEITKKELLIRLFGKDDTIRVFENKDLNFEVMSSRKRMEKALKSLGANSCQELLEEGPIEMVCEFTGNEETFDKNDLKELFGADWQHN